jgi:hypothetical protein
MLNLSIELQSILNGGLGQALQPCYLTSLFLDRIVPQKYCQPHPRWSKLPQLPAMLLHHEDETEVFNGCASRFLL